MAVLGPTASGKTDVAVAVAERLGAEVLSVDSMQVYRGMDIGTAKPSLADRRGIPHHMIDVADVDEEFSVSRFRELGRRIISESGAPLVIAGGSGLHFRALVDPMSFAPTDPELRDELESADPAELASVLTHADPQAGEHVDLANSRRVIRAVEIYQLTGLTPSERANSAEAEKLRMYKPEIEFRAVGLDPEDQLDSRIGTRLSRMREAGLVDEVERLWPAMGPTARGAVGYRELGAYLDGVTDLESAFDETARATRKLARRQRTWFRRDPRIHWIAWSDDPSVRVGRAMEALQ